MESQQRLSAYCADASHNIIPVSFMNGITAPEVNFANAGDNCTAFAGSTLLDCPELEYVDLYPPMLIGNHH